MKIVNKIKENIFLVFIIGAYLILTVLRPQMLLQSVKNSVYYIKEMIIIMPVILLLTALLDLWVSKEKILLMLGKESGAKGVLLSFVVGSISAGPIYAAFPLCVMLHKKGASIRSLIIILSSWAVIKVPMLINETKFLGPKFMLIRWVLTVIAILIFSWISAKMLKDEDLPDELPDETGLHINHDACMGCSMCTKKCPAAFEMNGKKAAVRADMSAETELSGLQEAIEGCPVRAITYNKK